MQIIALEIDNEFYEVLISDVFSTNNELKANVAVDFNKGDKDIDIDSIIDTLNSKKVTAHGLHLDHHIVITDCEIDFEVAYKNGIVKMFLWSDELPVWSEEFTKIIHSFGYASDHHPEVRQ